jgi:hypothetical protein
MLKTILMAAIQVSVALNLLYGAIFYKFAGVPFSIALFNTMSHAVHGLVSQPVFRIGAGVIETIAAILFLVPRTARLGAAVIAVYMISVLLSHVFVLGYGWAFADAFATFALPCLYLFLIRKQQAFRGASQSTQRTNAA